MILAHRVAAKGLFGGVGEAVAVGIKQGVGAFGGGFLFEGIVSVGDFEDVGEAVAAEVGVHRVFETVDTGDVGEDKADKHPGRVALHAAMVAAIAEVDERGVMPVHEVHGELHEVGAAGDAVPIEVHGVHGGRADRHLRLRFGISRKGGGGEDEGKHPEQGAGRGHL